MAASLDCLLSFSVPVPRGEFMNSFVLALALTPCPVAMEPTSVRSAPHVFLILADDLGYGDLSLHGNTNLATPHLDSLARDGARVDPFLVCPVCSPTRAEIMTGRYHPRCGVRDVTRGGERLNLDEKTMAESFREAGYATGLFGKWHHGTQFPYHPMARGFERFYGFTEGHWGSYFDAPMDDQGRLTRGKGFLADDITEKAIDFFRARVTGPTPQPVFCFLAFNTPHSPMQVPEPYWKRFAQKPLSLRATLPGTEDPDFTRAALAMVENLDDNVGKLLRAIDGLGQREQSIVVFLSDNGPNSARFNAGLKGRKGSVDEGGVRSPLFIRHPATIRAGTRVDRLSGAIDLFPTLTELAGVRLSPAPGKPLDGISIKEDLLGRQSSAGDRLLVSHWAGKTSVRSSRYRLDAGSALFDLIADPGQTRNIAADSPEVAKRLGQARESWKKEMSLPLPVDRRPFPIGHPAHPVTYLPARDGQTEGAVRRSGPAPNCSFFENWTQLGDRIRWSVDVLTEGDYEVILHHTCKEANLGAVIVCEWGPARLETTLTRAIDPPLEGAKQDRVPRKGESYVKDFQPLNLGTVHAKTGAMDLILRASSIPGKGVADVWMMELRRKPTP